MKRTLAVLAALLFVASAAIPAAAQEAGKNGELNYSYNLELPPGTNGAGPALNLVYNSMGGNGMLGLGWSLDGLPAICRDPSYKINFDHHDHYLFNGQKLVFANRQNGGDGYYHCEFEDFSRIEAFGNSVDYSYWVMTKKNGLKLYFGYKADEHTESTDGRILSTGQPNRAWIWALSKVEDVLGNYHIIEYEEDPAGGDYYPVRITYTKNNTNRLNKFRTVEFSYEKRGDALTYYSPARITVSHRLKWIAVKMDVHLVRKYELTYRTSALTGKSALCKISEYGSDGNAPWVPYTYKDLSTGTVYYSATGSILCSQDFSWLEAASGFSDLSLAPLNSGWTNYVVHGVGDFNGDGFTDVYLNTRHIWEGGTQHIWYGKAGGGYTDYSMNPLCGANDQAWLFTYIKGAGDFNGDGCGDLYVTSPVPEYPRVLYGKPEGGFRIANINVRSLSSELASYWTRGSILTSLQWYLPYAEGDFNGDGIADLLMRLPIHYDNQNEDHPPYLFYGKSEGGFRIVRIDSFSPAYKFLKILAVGDFNGDGRTDVYFNTPGAEFGTANQKLWYGRESDGFDVVSPDALGTGWSNYEVKAVGDFNGDGCTDLYLNIGLGAGGFQHIWYGKWGTGFNDVVREPLGSGWTDYLVKAIGDFNGDGYSDIFLSKNNLGEQAHQHIWYGRCGGGFRDFDTGILGSGWTDYAVQAVGDFNGDGKTDLYLNIALGAGGYQHIFSGSPGISDLISQFNNGLGCTTTITYENAPRVQKAVNSADKSYPYLANKSARPLVVRINVNPRGENAGDSIITAVSYDNGMIFVGQPYQRKGLGFFTVQKKNETTRERNVSYYYQKEAYVFGLPYRIRNFGSDGNLFSEMSIKYNNRTIYGDTNNKITFIYIETETTKKANGNPQDPPVYFKKQYAYDSCGNIEKTTNYGEVDAQGTDIKFDKVETATPFTVVVGNWIFFPREKTTSAYTLDNRWNVVNYEIYQYNSSTGLLESKTVTISRPENATATTRYSYDNWGNLFQLYDPRANGGEYSHVTLQITYDEDCRTYQVTSVNARGQATTTQYDGVYRPVSLTDANGVVWRKEYDQFGRITKEIEPQDSSQNPTVSYAYSPRGVYPSWISQSVKANNNERIANISYFDGTGREIQVKKQYQSGFITIDHCYDGSGREYKTSVPHREEGNEYSGLSAGELCTETEFDPVGRVQCITRPSGLRRRTEYGNSHTRLFDEKNHVTDLCVSGTEKATKLYSGTYPDIQLYSSTTTESRPDGVAITDALGARIVTKFDMLGRKKEYSDPVMGTWKYAYDANGNLIRQTDAKGNVIEFKYDELNRITKKILSGVNEVKYFYDESDHGYSIGRLCRVEMSNYSESYTYDSRGRISAVTKTIDGIRKTQSFTYDSMDRVTTILYPNNETLNLNYEESGDLESLIGNSVYMQNIEYSPLGKVTEMLYGNSTKMTFNYYDQAEEYDSGNNKNLTFNVWNIILSDGLKNILDIHYHYDDVANITQRSITVKPAQDQSNDYVENFHYDHFNRLILATSSLYQTTAPEYSAQKSYGYDNGNNIITKDGRTFTYSPGKKYTVDDDGLFKYSYDLNGNIISRKNNFTQTVRAFDWDSQNRLVRIADSVENGFSSSYAYGDGVDRVKKTEGTRSTYYFFDNYQEIHENGAPVESISYYFANGQRVAERSSARGVRYCHHDILSSSIAVTDAGKNIECIITYDPYGALGYYDTYQPAQPVQYTFTGKERDDSSLYYFGVRYYDPGLGRFISPDPVLNGCNRYAYCKNNPLKYSDPSGCWTVGLGIVGGWSKSQGWHFGFGFALDLTEEIGIGINASVTYGLGDKSYTYSLSVSADFAICYVGGGFSYNTRNGYSVSLSGGICSGLGVGFYTNHSWSREGRHSGYLDLKAMLGVPKLNIAIGLRITYAGGVPQEEPDIFYELSVMDNTVQYFRKSKSWGFNVLGMDVSYKSGNWSFNGYGGEIVGINASFNGGMKLDWSSETLDRIGKAWASPMTVAGIAVGTALCLADIFDGGAMPSITYQYNALCFITSFTWNGSGSAFTLGNTVMYGCGSTGPEAKSLRYNSTGSVSIGLHEKGHTLQYQMYGVFFFAFYFATGYWDRPNHSYLENAADDYAQKNGWFGW